VSSKELKKTPDGSGGRFFRAIAFEFHLIFAGIARSYKFLCACQGHTAN
jgi:hypothetical protein